MNANKQDAGGLPELPSPIGWYRAWLPSGEPVDEFTPGANRPDDWPVTDCAPVWGRRAMLAYGEQCRAASGEDVEALCESLEYMAKHSDSVGFNSDAECLRTAAALLRALSRGVPEVEYPEAAEVCAEAYQVVGCMLMQLGLFDTPEAEKILDNLSQHRMVHRDVLPWTIGPAIAAQRKEGR